MMKPFTIAAIVFVSATSAAADKTTAAITQTIGENVQALVQDRQAQKAAFTIAAPYSHVVTYSDASGQTFNYMPYPAVGFTEDDSYNHVVTYRDRQGEIHSYMPYPAYGFDAEQQINDVTLISAITKPAAYNHVISYTDTNGEIYNYMPYPAYGLDEVTN